MLVIHGGCHCEKKMRIPNEGGDSTPWTITCNMYMLTPKSCSNDFPDFNWDDFEVPAVSLQVATNS